MGKKKFLTAQKKAKQAVKELDVDDYLARGVDFEEAGEKWRGGDAAKSMRFFQRAIAAYEEGLDKFPESFDLAYNKARLQFDITQYPALLGQSEGGLESLLRVTLDSSRAALFLRQDNDDVLFNTAQVLSSLAEVITESNHASETSRQEALRLLEESVELFQRTLTLQEFKFSEMEATDEAPVTGYTANSNKEGGSEPQPSSINTSSPPTTQNYGKSERVEEWAEIVEPITKDTLLDTALSQLAALTTLCGIINADEGRGLAWVEEYCNTLIGQKIPLYASSIVPSRGIEITFARAKFLSAIAQASYRSGRIDGITCARAIGDAYSIIPSLEMGSQNQDSYDNQPSRQEILVSHAEAIIAFNTTLKERASPSDSGLIALRFKILHKAAEILTSASQAPDLESRELGRIHLLRGDVELLRFWIGNEGYAPAQSSAKVLAKNAGTYYRGAAKLSANIDSRDEVEAVVKTEIALRLLLELDESSASTYGGNPQFAGRTLANFLSSFEGPQQMMVEILEEAVADGLISSEWLKNQEIVLE